MSQLIRGWKRDEFSAPFAIWEVDPKILDTKSKITYLYLASKLDTDGQATPGYNEIAHACSFTPKSAKRAVEILEKVGLLQKINRWKGPKQKDTNLYILHHPEQVGLIARGRDTKSLPGDIKSLPRDTVSLGGRDTKSLPGDTGTLNNMFVGLSVVGELDISDVDKINFVWKQAFGERLNDIRAEGLIDYGKESGLDVEGIIKIIKDVAIHVDHFKKSPYATVLAAVKEGGWEFGTPASKPKSKREGKRSSQKGDSDLPKSIQKQMEQEAEGYKESKVDPEVQREILEELERMRENLGSRQ